MNLDIIQQLTSTTGGFNTIWSWDKDGFEHQFGDATYVCRFIPVTRTIIYFSITNSVSPHSKNRTHCKWNSNLDVNHYASLSKIHCSSSLQTDYATRQQLDNFRQYWNFLVGIRSSLS